MNNWGSSIEHELPNTRPSGILRPNLKVASTKKPRETGSASLLVALFTFFYQLEKFWKEAFKIQKFQIFLMRLAENSFSAACDSCPFKIIETTHKGGLFQQRERVVYSIFPFQNFMLDTNSGGPRSGH